MFRRPDRRDKANDPDDAREAAVAGDLDELEGDELEDDELDDEPGDRPEDMTADLESQAADYLADNDVWMYGPNAEAVLEILDRLEDLVPDEARPLAEAWLAIPKSDRDRARKAARKLAEENLEIGRHLQLAREAVGTWMAVTGPYPEFVNTVPDWGRLCSQAGEAALDAATAVILEGKIEESHYEALLEPWEETMALLEAAADAARLEGPDEGEPDEEDEESEEDGGDEEAERDFGPNSDAVTDFLNRLWLLTPELVGRLVSGWQNGDREDLKTAHESLNSLVDEDPEWRDQVRRAQKQLSPWLNAGRIEETAGFLGQAGQGESRKMAGPALADAVAALVLGDLLDRWDAEALYGPWFNLIGAPPLPEADEDEPVEEPAKAAAKAAAKPAAKAAPTAKPAAKPAAKAAPTAKPAAKLAAKAAAKPAAKAAAKPASAAATAVKPGAKPAAKPGAAAAASGKTPKK